MIILIGGETHTGKTLLAQKLLEQYHFPYTSLDHIKMGLIPWVSGLRVHGLRQQRRNFRKTLGRCQWDNKHLP